MLYPRAGVPVTARLINWKMIGDSAQGWEVVRKHLLWEPVEAPHIIHLGDVFTWENHVKHLWTFKRLPCEEEIEYFKESQRVKEVPARCMVTKDFRSIERTFGRPILNSYTDGSITVAKLNLGFHSLLQKTCLVKPCSGDYPLKNHGVRVGCEVRGKVTFRFPGLALDLLNQSLRACGPWICFVNRLYWCLLKFSDTIATPPCI